MAECYEQTESTPTESTNDQTVLVRWQNPCEEKDAAFVENIVEKKGPAKDGLYLHPYEMESTTTYAERKIDFIPAQNSEKIASALLNPVLTIEPERTLGDEKQRIEKDSILSAFIENSGLDGKNLTSSVAQSVKWARIQGVSFTIVDNFEDPPANKKEAVSQRKYPYIYTKRITQVCDYELNEYGKIVWIAFHDIKRVKSSDTNTDNPEMIETHRYWGPSESGEYNETHIYYMEDDKKIVYPDSTQKIGIKSLPVFPTFNTARSDIGTLDVPVPFYSICKGDWDLANQISEDRNGKKSTRYPMLVTFGPMSNSIKTGVHNFLNYPDPTTAAPFWLVPDYKIFESSTKDIEAQAANLISIAGLQGVQGVQSAKSGVAIEWEARTEEGGVQHVAQLANEIESQIIKLFGEYVTSENVDDYNCAYNNKITRAQSNSEVTDLEIQLTTFDYSSEVKSALKAKQIASDFKELLPQSQIDQLIRSQIEYDQQQKNKKEDEEKNNTFDEGEE